MGHVYGNQATFRRWLSGGDASRDPEQLTVLESSSRAVDAFCNRGSGFGPVIETRTFRCAGRRLLLGGDLGAYDALTVNDIDIADPPDVTDYTRVLTGYRGTIEITGPWSYPYRTVTIGALEDDLASDAESFTLADAAAYSPGLTLLVDDEQLLVTDASSTVVTLVRGVNGTTAAAHDDAATIRSYRYESTVVDATYRVAQRRWKQRDAGVNGAFGGLQAGGSVPLTANLDTEWSILLSSVSHLRFGFVR